MEDKPKILLIPDSPGWAMDNRCDALIKHLSDRYTFDKVYWCGMPERDYSGYDLIYYAGFYMVGTKRDKAFKQTVAVTTVSGAVKMTLAEIAAKVDLVAAFSIPNPLLLELRQLSQSEMFYAPNGVDADLFSPGDKPNNERFTVGWAGNSKHAGKRVEELKRACSFADAELRIQDMAERIPHDKMPDFYRGLDCYCCPSVSEGSNNCLLEAAACGIPLIATPTGNACEIIKYDGGFYVRDDLGDLESVIDTMRTVDRDRMGATLRERILSGWTWEVAARQFGNMFDYAMGIIR